MYHRFRFLSLGSMIALSAGTAALGGAAGDGAGGQDTNAGGAGGAQTPWWDAHPNAEVKTVLAAKNYADPMALATGYHELSKMHGSLAAQQANMIPLPGDNATDEDFGKIYDRLGRPKSPDEYQLKFGEEIKVDPRLEGFAKTFFHQAGVPAGKAQAMADKWNAFVAETSAADQKAWQETETAAINDLKKAHGDKYDGFVQAGQTAFKALGLDKAVHERIETAAGTSAYLTLMATLGQKMGGEAPFLNGDGGGGAATDPASMSPQQAQAEIDKLNADPEFQKVYTNPDIKIRQPALDRMTKLFEARARRPAA